jgi:hypothetical protein
MVFAAVAIFFAPSCFPTEAAQHMFLTTCESRGDGTQKLATQTETLLEKGWTKRSRENRQYSTELTTATVPSIQTLIAFFWFPSISFFLSS